MHPRKQIAYGIGIDLGTTCTSVALWRSNTGIINILPDALGNRIIPSAVAFYADSDGTENPVAGEAGANLRTSFGRADCVVVNAKRLIGRTFDEVLQDAHVSKRGVRHFQGIAWEQSIVRGPDGAACLEVPVFQMENFEAETSVRSALNKENASPEEEALGAMQKQIRVQKSPIQISAVILRKVRELIEAAIPGIQFLPLDGNEMCSIVLTVPAYFNDAQRKATLAAALLAGLPVDALLHEPTAAALAFGFVNAQIRTPQCEDQNGAEESESQPSAALNTPDLQVLVIDLGGGTLDVAHLEIEAQGSAVAVVASVGNSALGGQDFTEKLVDFCVEELRRKAMVDPSQFAAGTKKRARLTNECERVKRSLSYALQGTVELEGIFEAADIRADHGEYNSNLYSAHDSVDHPAGSVGIVKATQENIPKLPLSSIAVSRAKFELICANLFEAAMAPVKEIQAGAAQKNKQIEQVVLVGGGTRMPRIEHCLKQLMGPACQIRQADIAPEEIVCYGAAMRAAALQSKKIVQHQKIMHYDKPRTEDLSVLFPVSVAEDLLLLDVTPLTLGLEVAGGLMEPIIRRNTPLPVTVTRTFTTYGDQQTMVLLRVFEGERPLTKQNRFLGEFTLTDLPALPQGALRVDVHFTVDENAVLSVTAETSGSAHRRNKLIVARNGQTSIERRDLQRMLQEAEASAEKDSAEKERILLITELEVRAHSILSNWIKVMKHSGRRINFEGEQENKKFDSTEENQLALVEMEDCTPDSSSFDGNYPVPSAALANLAEEALHWLSTHREECHNSTSEIVRWTRLLKSTT